MIALVTLGLVEPGATFFIMLLNVGVLYLIMKKFLFVPVTNFMEKRRKGIEDSINEADNKIKEAEEYKNEYLAKLKTAEAEGKEIIDKAVNRANLKADSIVDEAKKEVSELKAKAEKDIALEKKKAYNEVKNEISSIAIMAAAKIIEAEVDKDKNEALVEKFIDEVGDMKWQD